MNVPVTVAMIAAVGVLTESRAEQAERRLDLWGAFTVTSGVLLLIHALASMPSHGWSVTTMVTCLLFAVCALALVLAGMQRQPTDREAARVAEARVPEGI